MQKGGHNTHTTMQNSIKLLALFTVTAFPAMAFADIAGLNAPIAVAAETGLYVYGSAFVALMALRDYARTPRTLRLPAPVLLPAREAFTTSPVAAIRRPATSRTFRAPQMS